MKRLINIDTIDESIILLKKVILDKNCVNMNLSNIKGYLGELLVAKKLSNYTKNVFLIGNQSGYDIELPDTGIKIDVKYSTIKSEIKNCPKYWGWALKQKSKKRQIKCSHFVCVAANDNFDVEAFYVIKKVHLNKFPKSAMRQFKNVERGFCLLHNKSMNLKIIDKSLRKYFKDCEILIQKDLMIKIPRSGNLLVALKN